MAPPDGAAKPVPGTGIGTDAAMDAERCNTGAQYGVYGRWDSSSIGMGPLCVRPFESGDDNGGGTSKGVTATAIKLVAVLPSPSRAMRRRRPRSCSTARHSQGTWADAVHDYLLAHLPFFETWGRDIDVTLYESTGIDETAQRADVVAILAEQPFAVINFDSFGLDTLVTSLAQAKVLVESFSVSPEESAAQTPYRWGGNDTDVAAASAAEVIGKNLAGKKAQYAGGDVKGKPRKFGLVTITDVIDESRFKKTLGKYGGTIATKSTYVGSGGALGDPTVAQQQAPVLVTRMKNAGVTTVVLFTDVAMNKAMMEQATAQEWFPEWFVTGAGYFDLPILAQSYPDDQAEHTFGLSLIPPYFDLPTEVDNIVGPTGAYNWFFGTGRGTTSGAVPGGLSWFLNGIHNAGPNLTPKTFKQGLFAAPATANPTHSPLVTLSGYGRTTALPYDAYSPGPADFAPMWMDPHTSGMSLGSNTEVAHVSWYIDEGRRYSSGRWPKNLVWFDKSNSIHALDGLPASATLPEAAAPCAQGQCPSTGATEPTVGTPSASGFIAKASPDTRATS